MKIKKAIAENAVLRVRDLMTTTPFTLTENDNLDTAQTMMRTRRVRHIPIVGPDDELIGLLTQRDLLASSVSSLVGLEPVQQAEILKQIPVAEAMKTEVKTVGPDMSLEAAAAVMLERKFGCLPVVDQYLVGILTEADFVRLTLNLLAVIRQPR